MSKDTVHQRVKKLLYTITGITLGDGKDVMIDNRLQKLSRSLNCDIDTYKLLDKIEHGEYITDFVNAFTTNKTSFFREHFHFEDLRDRVVPNANSTKEDLKVYCSASSTGEEPYSIAMTLIQSAIDINAQDLRFSLISTDIDTEVLKKSKEGIYTFNINKNDFPLWIKPAQYFQKRDIGSSDEILIKAKSSLKSIMKFEQMNLMSDSYPFESAEFDIIFCRNVLIYFSIEDQNKILKKLFKLLKIGGTLYLGHSENPLDLHSYVKRIGHNIFIKEKEYI